MDWVKVGRYTFVEDEVVCVASTEEEKGGMSYPIGLQVVLRSGYVMKMNMEERRIFLPHFASRKITDLSSGIGVQSAAPAITDVVDDLERVEGATPTGDD